MSEIVNDRFLGSTDRIWPLPLRAAHRTDGRLAALRAFQVPFVLYDRQGGCRHVSAAAQRIVGSTCDGDGVWSQLRQLVMRAMSSKAARDDAPESLLEAIDGSFEIRAHPYVVGGTVDGAIVILSPLPTNRNPSSRLDSYGLTERQREVARLIALGYSTKRIAGALGISPHTARHHTERLFAKVGVGGRTHIARLMGN